jgi:cytochrome c
MPLTSKSLALRYRGLVAALACSISLIAPQVVGAQSVTPSSPSPSPTSTSSPTPSSFSPLSSPSSLSSPLSSPTSSSLPLPAALAPTPPPPVPNLSFDAGLELARKKTCLGCHQVDSKRVGPSLQAVAQRHAAQSGSLEYLASAIRQGGRGRWGAVPMPAQTQVNQQDALQLAQWILNLR